MLGKARVHAKFGSIHSQRRGKVNYPFIFRTVGYGLVNKIKPAKKLTEEQKIHLGAGKEETNLEGEMKNLKVEN